MFPNSQNNHTKAMGAITHIVLFDVSTALPIRPSNLLTFCCTGVVVVVVVVNKLVEGELCIFMILIFDSHFGMAMLPHEPCIFLIFSLFPGPLSFAHVVSCHFHERRAYHPLYPTTYPPPTLFISQPPQSDPIPSPPLSHQSLQPPSIHTSHRKQNALTPSPPFSKLQILPHIPATETSALCKRMLALQTKCVRTDNGKPYILSVRGGANCSIEEDVKVSLSPSPYPPYRKCEKRDGW